MESYKNADTATQVRHYYERAVAACNSLIEAGSALDTFYAKLVIRDPVTRLLEHLRANFSASPFSLRPTLRVSPSEKKYPFHLPHQALVLNLDVENSGPGYAYDVTLSIIDVTDAAVTSVTTHIGDMAPTLRRVPITISMNAPRAEVVGEFELVWHTYDKQAQTQRYTLAFETQNADVDWPALAKSQPYDLDPATEDNTFVGRSDLLNQLHAMTRGKGLNSAIVYGQKRVGKTSLVKTLQSQLERTDPELVVIYFEGGDYVRPDPIRTIQELGRRLCTEILSFRPVLSQLTLPRFDDALAPVTEFLAAAIRLIPSLRILIILDEFDELPTDLYTRSDIASAFFLSLRALSARPYIGFLLVGGEKMQAVINFQGQQLNKFSTMRVDYFDRDLHWQDFVALVSQPTRGALEFTSQALNAVYDYTAGNPYFSKMICASLFKLMVARRDGHVTSTEVHETASLELRTVAPLHFSHFWDDGIVESGPDKEAISLVRRKTLLAFADASRRVKQITLREIQEAAADYELAEGLAKQVLQEFVEREVVIHHNEYFSLKVPFLGEWLKESGVRHLLSTLSERIMTSERKRAEESYIRREELQLLVDRWGRYKGAPITIDGIRAWLQQFGPNNSQRLMYQLLCAVRMYRDEEIKKLLQRVYREILRHRYEGRSERTYGLVVSFLPDPGKTGGQYAKLFAEVNTLSLRSVVDPSEVFDTARVGADVRTMIFIDDFLNTGQVAVNYFTEHSDELRAFVAGGGSIYFACLAGFRDSSRHFEEAMAEARIPIKVIVCDLFDDSDRCFHETSKIFPDPSKRAEAKAVAMNFGGRLTSQNVLGKDNAEAAIVFERSCPNADLPILWLRRPNWTPLFSRM